MTQTKKTSGYIAQHSNNKLSSMTVAELVGMRVSITVSDPWDFGTEHGTGPFAAKVLQAGSNYWVSGEDALLLQLETSLSYQGSTCEYFVATPRFEIGSLASLISGYKVECNFTRVPESRTTSANPFDLSWWRGGVGLIGTLQKS